ncbi:MAG: HDOD domain-containing protein [Planctomycetes bacterium]|nr:HDOD domain-containing protein [Planctomycetota bacterium]
MGVFSWLQNRLLPVVSSDDGAAAQPVESSAAPGASKSPPAALPTRKPVQRRPSIGALDRPELLQAELAADERELAERLAQRVAQGRFELPRLAPTSSAAIALAERPSVEIKQLVETISHDPLLTSEMLRVANSAMYSTQNPAGTLQQAVMRIGLRSVHGVALTAAVRSSIGNHEGVRVYSEEVWRQSQSAARIARALGVALGFEAEEAHVIGLLHDVGKIVVLDLIESETRGGARLSSACVAQCLFRLHETAGAALAKAWRLPEALASVAGRHHDFQGNSSHPRQAALAYLAQELDLRLSIGDDEGLQALEASPAFEVLGAPEELRAELVHHGRHVWESAEEALGSQHSS